MPDSDSDTWVDLDALAEEDPMRRSALAHLEEAEGIDRALIEEAIEQQGLQLVQTLYETSMSDDEEADPMAVLARLGVVEAEPEQAAASPAAPNDQPDAQDAATEGGTE